MPRETLTTLKNRIADLEPQLEAAKKTAAIQLRFIGDMSSHYVTLAQNLLVIIKSVSEVKLSIAKFLEESGMATETPVTLPPVPPVPNLPFPPDAIDKQ